MASTKKGEMENGPAHHTFSHDHRVDFDGAVILDVEKKKWLRKKKPSTSEQPILARRSPT